MSLLRPASLLLLLAAFAGPWLAGAQTTIPQVRWWLASALTGAFLLVVAARFWPRRRLKIPALAVPSVTFLLGCLTWWATQPELPFATAFSAEHWDFLKDRYPRAIFQWPRMERLAFHAALLLGFLAAIELGRFETFRRVLCRVIGLSAVGVAAYAIGMANLNWPDLPWTLIDGDTERFNVCFSHYSGPPACLNLGWPLLVFGAASWRGRAGWGRSIAVLVVVVAALPLWPSAAGKSIALGLLISGAGWAWGANCGWLSPKWVCGTVAGLFLFVSAAQLLAIERTQSLAPDGWVSAVETFATAPEWDAKLRAAASLRGDHLVASPAGDRPAGWLAGLRMAADYPLVGLGPGAWVKNSALYTYDTVVRTFYHYRQYTHNDLIQWAAEWGGLATVAMLVLWFGGLWNAVHRDRRLPLRDSGLVLALLGAALHGTVDFPLQIPALQLWTALLLGLAWSSGTRTRTKLSTVQPPHRLQTAK